MKLLCFDEFRIGLIEGDQVLDVTDVVSGSPGVGAPDLMLELIAWFPAYKERLSAAKVAAKPLHAVRIRPPLPRPRNIVCMAVNYLEGQSEAAKPANAFHKAPSAIIGSGDAMVLPDVPATVFEGEAELAAIIGKRASHVKRSEAMEHVFGYMNFIDGSARGLGVGNNFFQMKSRDTFAPIGPWIVTADEIADPHDLQVRLWVNGTLKQDFSTSDMARRIPECIEFLSAVHTLEPGDIVATGTDHRGLSAFQDGDRVEMETDPLGRLKITIRDELKRSWPRDTRQERKRLGLEPLATAGKSEG